MPTPEEIIKSTKPKVSIPPTKVGGFTASQRRGGWVGNMYNRHTQSYTCDVCLDDFEEATDMYEFKINSKKKYEVHPDCLKEFLTKGNKIPDRKPIKLTRYFLYGED